MKKDFIRSQNLYHQKGSVLVTALLLLVVMTLLGASLMQISVLESKVATYKTINSEVFHVTESCTRDVMTWLADQSTPQSTVPDVTQSSLSHLYTTAETTQPENFDYLSKLEGYSYNCSTTYLLKKSVTGDSVGQGTDVSLGTGYGISEDSTPRYYYQVDSTGSGPQSATKQITTIVSVEY